MPLRAFAFAAPQFVAGTPGQMALNSADPASLFNACRVAAAAAEDRRGAWGAGNWAGGRAVRRDFVRLFEDWPEASRQIEEICLSLRPNLVLIGAMSICFRGAVECAAQIKRTLGDDVCVVLGGRHVSETIWQENGSGDILEHAAAPSRLMRAGKIGGVFDVVLAGDGEFPIWGLGELVARLTESGFPAASAAAHLDEIRDLPGRWIAGAVKAGAVRMAAGTGPDIDYASLGTPAALFGVKARFDVLGGKPTAHVFSDIGRGCIYDCAFCSERISVVGAPRQMETSALRLVRHLRNAAAAIEEDYGKVGAGAFCEDSTLLGFSPKLVRAFCRETERQELRISLGGQLTVDQILRGRDLLFELRSAGLEYLFVGLETPDPSAIGGMSKDVGHKRSGWLDRSQRALEALSEAGIAMGVSLLFGLGETPAAREMLFEHLVTMRREFGQPYPLSMNWAVQHPLRGQDGGTGYEFLDWAAPEGELLEVLRNFGEASVAYPIAGQQPPALAEASGVVDAVRDIMATKPFGMPAASKPELVGDDVV